MSRVVLRNAWWITIGATLLSLLSLVGCSQVQPKLAQVSVPSVAPVRQRVTQVKVATASAKVSSEAARVKIDEAIVLAHQEAVAATEAERSKAQELLKVSLQAAKKSEEDANQRIEVKQTRKRRTRLCSEVVVSQKAQDDTAVKIQKVEAQNEDYRQRAISGEKIWGLGYVWVGLKMFAVHAILWIAGFAVILGALSFFVPAVGAFVTMVLTNIFKLFTRR